MRRAQSGHTEGVLRVVAAVVSAVAAFAVGVAAGGADSENRTPRLRLADAAPLTLRGTGFVPHERVRVTVAVRTTRTKRVVAGRSGAFVARFAGNAVHRCDGLFAQASGSEGSLARLKRPPTFCPPN
jgi:hypothetical protein